MTLVQEGGSFRFLAQDAFTGVDFPRSDGNAVALYANSMFKPESAVLLDSLHIVSSPSLAASAGTIDIIDSASNILWTYGLPKVDTAWRQFDFQPNGLQMPAGGFGINTHATDWKILATFRLQNHIVPVVTSITPNSGTAAGGVTTRFRGQFFGGGLTTGATISVQFGLGNSATNIQLLQSGGSISDSTFTCVTPAVGAGVVDVYVTVDGSTRFLAGAYTFV